MKTRMNQRRRVALLALAVLGPAVGLATMAGAAHTVCDDEGIGGGDFGVDVGPGAVFVGTDGLGDVSVCSTSGGPLPPSNETVTLNLEDPNPATTGLTAAVDHRSCADQAGTSCTTTSPVGQTGFENLGASPSPDTPGGGTFGLGLTVTNDCLWVNGTASCGPDPAFTATAWESDLPTTATDGCLADLPPNSGCDLQGVRVTVLGDPVNPLIRVQRSAVPGVPDGGTNVDADPVCLGAGTTCP